jgi:quinoprotein glucose dehydrogenase
MRSLVLAFVCVASGGLVVWAKQSPNTDWALNGGPGNARYSPLTQITKENVGQLQVAWTYEQGDHFTASEMQSNPVVAGGAVYFTTPSMQVVALAADTGKKLWQYDPTGGATARTRARHRGVTVHADRVFVSYRNFLIALDRKTGQPIAEFATAGKLDLREGFGKPVDQVSVSASTPPVIFEDLVILPSSVPETLPGTPGHIRAFEWRTGKPRWTFHTIPQPGEFGYDTWPEDAFRIAGGANAWAGLTVDPAMDAVFAATGSASFDFYGTSRKGDNLFANCVLAIDARTGKRLWHFQGVKHDLWDWDFPAPPTLVTVTRNGRRVDAVAQTTKYGDTFVLDRHTGESLFPIEQRRVPPSRVDGEFASPTQPRPLKPTPFARQGLTEAMLTTRTPEAHADVLKRFKAMRSGMFEPPSLEGTIVFPGFDGGAEWGGSAFDPSTGLLFVNSNEMPWVIKLIPNDDTSLYNSKCATCHKTDRSGTPVAPTLVDIGKKLSRDQIMTIVRQGTGRMPAFPDMGARNIGDVADFLLTGKDKGADPAFKSAPGWLKYRSDGESIFLAPDGYPAITPPWGTLNAIDLNSGDMRWRIPLGEVPDLAAKGMTNTGSDNYGGPIVTASGLLFIGATNFDRKFRAFEAATGTLLWETALPAAGNATPSTYMLNGRQYVVIACGGGKNGAPSGSSVVAFALPAR